MSAPLAVNTTDGLCWTRREVTRDGRELYALEAVKDCPAHLMETYAELEERGIVGSADVLPVPVGPVVPERDRLRAAYIAALDEASRTHPCPAYGDQIWSGCVHYDDAGRVSGVGSCHSERRADAVLAVRDAEVVRLRAQVAALLAERHETNEALDDVVRELRARQSCPCSPTDQPGPHQVGCPQAEVPSMPARSVSSREEPHGSPLYQSYRVPHDLPVPPSCRLGADGLDEISRDAWFGGGGA